MRVDSNRPVQWPGRRNRVASLFAGRMHSAFPARQIVCLRTVSYGVIFNQFAYKVQGVHDFSVLVLGARIGRGDWRNKSASVRCRRGPLAGPQSQGKAGEPFVNVEACITPPSPNAKRLRANLYCDQKQVVGPQAC